MPLDQKTIISTLKEVLKPSIDICNSAFHLATSRCDYLDISPVLCWILLKMICERSIRNELTTIVGDKADGILVDEQLRLLEKLLVEAVGQPTRRSESSQ